MGSAVSVSLPSSLPCLNTTGSSFSVAQLFKNEGGRRCELRMSGRQQGEARGKGGSRLGQKLSATKMKGRKKEQKARARAGRHHFCVKHFIFF